MHPLRFMGRPEIEIPDAPYVYGGDTETLCRECQLPCQFEVTSVDCLRRFFLQGFLQCSYFVHGYCFLIDKPGCVFDNGGEHEEYWLGLLNDYFHKAREPRTSDPGTIALVDQFEQLVSQQIADRQVSLCRYFEEVYNRVMEDGGGLSEAVMEKLDEAYLALLSGTSRKKTD